MNGFKAISQLLTGLALACSTLPAWSQSVGVTTAQAKKTLFGHGLVPAGNIWITSSEVSLKRIVDSLEAAERRHQQAITKADEALAANEKIRARLSHAEAAERVTGVPSEALNNDISSGEKEPSKSNTDPPAKLSSQLPDVTGVGEQTPLQQAMIELVNARTAMQLAVLAIYRNAPKMQKEYAPLKEDKEIRVALQQLNSNARLGPARNYQRDLVRAESIAAGVFKNEIPGFFESGWFRVTGILNESQPVTFNFQPKDGPLLLSASAVQRLGLTGKEPVEPAREVEVAGRSVTARPIKLASLRLGDCMFKDVSALVLPPEAEDLGSQLSPGVLVGYQVTVQPRRMILALNSLRRE